MNRPGKFPIRPILLAGGKSSRMGEDKSFVQLEGVPLIQVVLQKISPLFSLPPLVVTNSPKLYSHLGIEMTSDLIQDKGPLGGIHAALTYSQAEYNFIFACDMPFIQESLIAYMLENFQGEDVVMPRYNWEQPLHAIYAKRCLPAIEHSLQQGQRKVIDFLSEVRVRYLEIEEILKIPDAKQAFININNQQDLKEAKLLWKNNQSNFM